MRKWLILIVSVLLCTGCTALPAEERAFAVVLAVDHSGDTWQVSARIPTYQTGGGYTTVRADGTTLPAALAAMDAAAPMHLHLGQLRMVVISKRLADQGHLPAVMDVLSARHDLRLQAQLVMTEETLPILMEGMKPSAGTRLSKSLDVLLESRKEQGMLLPSTLADVLRMGERQSPVLPALTLSEEKLAIAGGWPIGRDGKPGVLLSLTDVQLLTLLQGGSFTGTLTLPEGSAILSSASCTVELHEPLLQSASLRLKLRCASLTLTEEAFSRAAANACLGVLNRLSAAGCDALGLARQAIRHAKDMEEWHAIGWPDRYAAMDWSVSVGVEGPA